MNRFLFSSYTLEIKKSLKKFNRTSEKFKIPFLEHQILEASRHHQLPQYAPQIEAYQLSFTLHLRVCQSAHAILRNSVFTENPVQEQVKMGITPYYMSHMV